MVFKRNIFRRLFPLFILGLYFTVLFYKVIVNGLWPIPADSLVSYFFPWNTGGWGGWYEGITHKGLIGFDVFRHYIPWKSLGAELIKSGQLPLWNPYNFSGNPLMANFQSSFFYPFSVIFYFLPIFPSWIIFIFLQPVLGFFGFYLYLKLIVKNRISALFGSLAFISSGFFLAWFTWGIVGHSYIWAGWLLWVCHKYFIDRSYKHLLITPLLIFISIISPYPQVAILVLILVFSYSIFCFVSSSGGIARYLKWIIASVVGILIAMIQIIPTIELWSFSPRDYGVPDVFELFALKKRL